MLWKQETQEKNIKLHFCLHLQGVSLQRSLINYNDHVSCLKLHTLASEKCITHLWGTCELANIIGELADTFLKTFLAFTNRKEKTSGSIIVTEPFWKIFFLPPSGVTKKWRHSDERRKKKTASVWDACSLNEVLLPSGCTWYSPTCLHSARCWIFLCSYLLREERQLRAVSQNRK